MATLTPTPTETIQSAIASLMSAYENEPKKIVIPRHPLIQTSKLAGGLTIKQTMGQYHINIYHTDDLEARSLRARDTVLRSHIELQRDGTVRIGIHDGKGEADKHEEHLAYSMSSYLPGRIIMQALRRQPRSFTASAALDELDEMIDFLDYTTKYAPSI